MERIERYDKTIVVSSNDIDMIRDAAKHLREGEVVAFPTETVYGLGANAYDSEAVSKIFEAKGRPNDNPLIVHVASKDQINELVSTVTPLASKLIESFMPGPITVIMPKSERIPMNVTAGLNTVGIRMPIHPVANMFINLCECPVAAPSANLSGKPSPTRASHVFYDMNKYIYAILEGGESEYGLESTVVDATSDIPIILRPGAITCEQIEKCCGVKPLERCTVEDKEIPVAPGMKYRHYAPIASVEIIEFPREIELDGEYDTLSSGDSCSDEEVENYDSSAAEQEISEEERRSLFEIAKPFIMRAKAIIDAGPCSRIGLFCGEEVRDLFHMLNDEILLSHVHFFVYGKANNVSQASHYLFDGLRTLDRQKVDVILAVGFCGDGLSRAYMNRLSKASVKDGKSDKDNLLDSTNGISGCVNLSLANGEGDSGSSNLVSSNNGSLNWRSAMTSSILFACRDNRSLSVAAEGIFDRLLRKEGPFCSEVDRTCEAEIYCESAGIVAIDGEKANDKMLKALNSLDINMSYHLTQRATAAIYDQNDLILTLRDENAKDILNSFPDLTGRVYSLSSYQAKKGLVIKDDRGRVVSFSIPDPSGESDETYLHTVKAISAWLELLFPYILKDLGVERA